MHSYVSSMVTYNLTIEGLHTYYVVAGQAPVLVHNGGDTPITVDNTDLQNIVDAMFHGIGNPGLVGDGSALAAANEQAKSGMLLYNQDHLASTSQYKTALQKFLSNSERRVKKPGQKAVTIPIVKTQRDIDVATELIAAIDDAHAGKYIGLANYPSLGC